MADTGAQVDSAIPDLLGTPTFVDMGEHTSGDTVFLEVPAGTLGFHVVVEVASRVGNESVGIQVVRAPSGEFVTRDYIVAGAGFSTTLTTYGIAAASVPANPHPSAMPVETGTWAFLIAGFETSGAQTTRPLRVRAYLQSTDDGAFHGGVLDLHVHIPSGLQVGDPGPVHGVDAAGAATDEAMGARVDSFYDGLLELYGIGRGEVRYHDIDASHRTVADGTILAAARATESVASGPAMHVVYVNELRLGGDLIWGISATNPGVQHETGMPTSAIIVNVSAGFSGRADGLTTLHELGHFVGLFHTTETSRTIQDPLTDTPFCATAAACEDGHNIMFPVFWGASGGVDIVSSPQQQAIVQGSVVWRANRRALTTTSAEVRERHFARDEALADALSPVELAVAETFCGHHGPLDLDALVARFGEAALRSELVDHASSLGLLGERSRSILDALDGRVR